MALLRAVGSKGEVISYEIREDFAERARINIENFMGRVGNFQIKLKDIYKGIDEEEIDRIVLDVPEPWTVIPHAIRALKQGGIFLSYLPTIIQVKKLVDELRNSGRFRWIHTIEVLIRSWNVLGMSVRPAHRMVAHTGFITLGRKTGQFIAEQ